MSAASAVLARAGTLWGHSLVSQTAADPLSRYKQDSTSGNRTIFLEVYLKLVPKLSRSFLPERILKDGSPAGGLGDPEEPEG